MVRRLTHCSFWVGGQRKQAIVGPPSTCMCLCCTQNVFLCSFWRTAIMACLPNNQQVISGKIGNQTGTSWFWPFLLLLWVWCATSSSSSLCECCCCCCGCLLFVVVVVDDVGCCFCLMFRNFAAFTPQKYVCRFSSFHSILNCCILYDFLRYVYNLLPASQSFFPLTTTSPLCCGVVLLCSASTYGPWFFFCFCRGSLVGSPHKLYCSFCFKRF